MPVFSRTRPALCAAALLAGLAAPVRAQPIPPPPLAAPAAPLAAAATPALVVATYAAIAQAMYEDALISAKDLQTAVDAFLAAPNAQTLAAARKAWIEARVWYQRTEGYRFGNPSVDAMEGKINAWPLDEGLIDYVDVGRYGETNDENPLFRANVVANARVKVGKAVVDARRIDRKLLAEKLHEAGGVEANVATGYHAVEFLLWGQDLNGTGPGAGNRPAADYDLKACAHGHCDRRRAYLKAATDLLVDDLKAMAALWSVGGKARADLAAKTSQDAVAAIFTGLGSLSYGELAGERMKLGLLLHDPEEEHDCFSDNTHNSHYFNQAGMTAIWRGVYARRDGVTISGPAPRDLARAKSTEAAAAVDARFEETTQRLAAIKRMAEEGGKAYDQMLASGAPEGPGLIQPAVDALIAQTRALEAVVAALDLKVKVQGSDSLDDAGKVKPKS